MSSSMPHPTPNHQADTGEDVVVGVDTDKDVHVAAIVSSHGTLLDTRTFRATAAGYRQLLAWAGSFGTLRRAGVEGSSSYGTAVTRHLCAAGLRVIEVNRPDRAERRRRGKTDAIDAEAAARAVLSARASAAAKTSDGPVEMVRMLTMAKTSAVKSRTQAINQLKAVLVRADPALRESLSGLSNRTLVRRCADLDPGTAATINAAAAYTLRSLARRIAHLSDEIAILHKQITTVLTAYAPKLLGCYGVGPDTAAALLITAGDNPTRMHSEASFAALCGVSPIEASSGKTQRRRLNRGGDRRANSALYTIALSRLRWNLPTRDYLTRRLNEGKTRRETIRCLKRYIAREIYQIITAPRRHPAQPLPATGHP